MTGTLFSQERFRLNQYLCFVVMPFDPSFRGVYDIVEDLVENYCGLKCVRADDIFASQRIAGDIWKHINEARVIVADLTGRNANVFYEVGLAHALGKQVILIAQDSSDVPFDLRDIRYIRYAPHETGKLRRELIEYLMNYISTIPNGWDNDYCPGNCDHAYIKLTSLNAPPYVAPGQPFEITLKARNNGRDASQGYFSVSFPSGIERLSIESNIDARVGQANDPWGAGKWELSYPIAEGFLYSSDAPVWLSGKEYSIKVRAYTKHKGLLWFYVSASCRDAANGKWYFDPEPRLLDVDQRNENVYCGVIEVK